MMLVYDAAQVLDIAGPVQILSAAIDPATGAPAYEIELVAEEPGPVSTTSGLALRVDRSMADVSPSELATLDTFMVIGGHGSRTAMENERLLAFVRRASRAARRTVSICTGSVILAAAVLENIRYVRDGNLVTAAGVSAGIDMALWLTGQMHGEDHARLTQLAMQYDPAPPYAAAV